MSESLQIPTLMEEYDKEVLPWMADLKKRSLDKWVEAMRWYSKNDLWWLTTQVLDVGKVIHTTYHVPVYHHQRYVDSARQYERQLALGEGLDCSARRSGKSEWRSCGVPIYLMLSYPDISMLIMSVEKALALNHFRRIQMELTHNKLLLYLFPELFFANPVEESSSGGIAWSKAEGLTIKGRTANTVSTPTVWTAAFYGGGPVGSGPDAIFADDIERSSEVATPEGIDKLDAAFSENTTLLTPRTIPKEILFISNTRFAPNGLVQRKFDKMKAKNEELVREVPAEIIEEGQDDRYVYGDKNYIGPMGGRISWPYTQEYLMAQYEMKEKKSEYILQLALSYRPVKEASIDWNLIHFFDEEPRDFNIGGQCVSHILIDPSNGVHDPSAMLVVGLTHDKRRVLLDAVVKKLNPDKQEFYDAIFGLVMKWSNLSQRVAHIRVEEAGPSNWGKLIRDEMTKRGCFVNVVPCRIGMGESAHKRQLGDRKFRTGKADRIWNSWSPALHRGDVWMPRMKKDGGYGIICDITGTGEASDVVEYLVNTEMRLFPVAAHDDILDAWSLLDNNKANMDHPLQFGVNTRYDDELDDDGVGEPGVTWMSGGN